MKSVEAYQRIEGLCPFRDAFHRCSELVFKEVAQLKYKETVFFYEFEASPYLFCLCYEEVWLRRVIWGTGETFRRYGHEAFLPLAKKIGLL